MEILSTQARSSGQQPTMNGDGTRPVLLLIGGDGMRLLYLVDENIPQYLPERF